MGDSYSLGLGKWVLEGGGEVEGWGERDGGPGIGELFKFALMRGVIKFQG